MTTSTLPPLDDPITLDPQIVEGFARDGCALVRGLASSDEAAAYLPLIEKAAIDTAWNKDQAKGKENLERVFLQSFSSMNESIHCSAMCAVGQGQKQVLG